MSIRFVGARTASLAAITAEAPDGSIVGVVGEESPALASLLRLAAGLEQPEAGRVSATEPRRLLGASDSLNLDPIATLALEHTLACRDAVVRARARIELERLRRSGASILLLSQEQELLGSICDEVWWIHQGALAAKGDPREVLEVYNRHVARELRNWAATVSQPLSPSMRRGDGRAQIVSVQTLDADGGTTMVWRSGESVAVQVCVRFDQSIEDPVVGIMIRTRVGFEVFGTNTELEGVKLGPVEAGDTVRVKFRFRCDLCPQDYTVTAASHDPDGVWHDWMEDAVAFTVSDTRYTAGVANLRALVDFQRE